MMDSLAYITVSSPEEAARIGQALVDKKLAACVNILPGMTSIYRWEGKLERSQETVLIAKTNQANRAALTKLVEALHSYDTPCVLWLAIEGGSEKFLKWAEGELQGS